MFTANTGQVQPLPQLGLGENSTNTKSTSPLAPMWSETQTGLITKLRQVMLTSTPMEALLEIQHIASTYSELLSDCFKKKLEHPNLVSSLIQELKDEGTITEQEWKRLTILRMVLDGMDVEVSEYDEKLRHEDFNKVIEYCEIIKAVMLRHRVQVGVTWASNYFQMCTANTSTNWNLETENVFSSVSNVGDWSFTAFQAIR